jgi:hypothetical protein
MKKVIVRIKGGLGNQMFCYAAARRLALVNNAELVIDDVTGFVRDHTYKRSYMLDNFNIRARKATPAERFEPFERCRRVIMKYMSRTRPFEKRKYLEQEAVDFDERLLSVKIKGTLYLDGYWQSERYFLDSKDVIAQEFDLPRPNNRKFLDVFDQVRGSDPVAVGVRLYEEVPAGNTVHKVAPFSFYNKAADLIKSKTRNPVFFVFCTKYGELAEKLKLPGKTYYITHDNGYEGAIERLWLISRCRRHIISNSSFYWWGAWLSEYRGSADQVIACDLFNASQTIPERWLSLSP